MRSVVVIPARFASSRYPGKPLVPLLGKPMVIWVAELSARAVGRESVYVATEDSRIADVVRQAGFNVLLTSPDALTGTDRVAEAAEQIEADIYVNVQGDEPSVDPDDILKILAVKQSNPGMVVNGFSWIDPKRESVESLTIPKVVTAEDGTLLYISRAAIPGSKDPGLAPHAYKKQVCIYAFNKAELRAFRAFGRKGELERYEDIEILRFFELKIQVRMVETLAGSVAVDVVDDVRNAECKLRDLHRL